MHRLRAAPRFLAERLLIHALYQCVDVVTHGLELVPERSVFMFEMLFLHFVVAHAFNESRSLLHFG